VGDRGPQLRQPAGVLRRAHRRAEGVDPGGLDRHVSWIREGDPRARGAPARPGLLRPLPCRPTRLKAADQVRRDEYNQHGRSATGEGKWIKGTRYSLLKDTAKQTAGQLLKLAEVVLTNKRMYRAFLLYGELRYIYKLPKDEAKERLDAWLSWASRSRLKPFGKLARTIRKHKAGVLAAVELGLSNGRLEALNSKVRLLSHRAYGFRSADALIAMIYLCCAGIQIALPHR
jgi:transposase